MVLVPVNAHDLPVHSTLQLHNQASLQRSELFLIFQNQPYLSKLGIYILEPKQCDNLRNLLMHFLLVFVVATTLLGCMSSSNLSSGGALRPTPRPQDVV